MSDHRLAAASNSPVEFVRGAMDIWRGFSMLLSRPALWVWAIIPFFLNVLVFALLAWGVSHYAGGWVEGKFLSNQGFWMSAAGWAIQVIIWIAVGLLIIFCFVPLATLIAAPFNDILSEKVEKIYRGVVVHERFSWNVMTRSVLSGLNTSLRLSLKTIFWLALAMLLNFVPLFGPALATAVSAFITIRFLSLQFTSYSMDRRFYSWPQRRAFLRRHRARTIGLGSMAFLIM